MIAIIRPPEKPPRPAALRRAHRLLAATLLPAAGPRGPATIIAGWKAWLFVAWLLAMSLWGGFRFFAAMF